MQWIHVKVYSDPFGLSLVLEFSSSIHVHRHVYVSMHLYICLYALHY